MFRDLTELHQAYAAEMRTSKELAELWCKELNDRYDADPQGLPPADLWPAGPASHPWVIATYRKYFFLCAELNRRVIERQSGSAAIEPPGESAWGVNDDGEPSGIVEPKVFVFDLLSGGETDDLYEFLSLLVFVPIGLKHEQPA